MADDITKTQQQASDILDQPMESVDSEGYTPPVSEQRVGSVWKIEPKSVETPKTPTPQEVERKAQENLAKLQRDLIESVSPPKVTFPDTDAAPNRADAQRVSNEAAKGRSGYRYERGKRVGD